MTSPSAGSARDPHAGHDREALAAYAAGDASADDRTRAEALVRDCEACSLLVDDLRAIASATRHLPAPAAIARDFRLSRADAVRLAGSRWRRILRTLGLTGWNPRPFAAALTTLGVAGLLIAVLPFMSLGSAASGGAETGAAASDQKAVFGPASGDYAASPAASSVASADFPAGVLASATTAGSRDSGIPEDLAFTPAPTEQPTVAPAPEEPPHGSPGSPLLFLSLGFIAAGGALFALGRSARGRP